MREIIELSKAVAEKRPIANFSLEESETALRKELKKLVTEDGTAEGKITSKSWNKGKYDVFAIVQETIDATIPQEIDKILYEVAEVKHYKNGDKPRFRVNTSNLDHIRRFVTKVTKAGRYKRTRLDEQYLDVEIYQHGGAVYQSWEDVLSGRGSIADLFSQMMVALEFNIYDDVASALDGIAQELPPTLVHTGSFDINELYRIGTELKKYGQPTIYCTETFAFRHLASEPGVMSEVEKLEIRNRGYNTIVKGMPTVVLPAGTVMSDDIAYILPAGIKDKPIKIAYEGETQVRDFQNESWDIEIQWYKKVGVAVVNAANKMGLIEVED